MIKKIASVRSLIVAAVWAVVVVFFATGLFVLNVHHQADEEQTAISERVREHLTAANELRYKYLQHNHQWQSILLRGQDVEQYHNHLAQFYELERDIRDSIKTLKTALIADPRSSLILDTFAQEFQQLGRDYRRAIRVYNETDSNPHVVADKATKDVATADRLINEFVAAVNALRQRDLLALVAKIESKENMAIFVAAIVLIALMLLIMVLANKLISRPILRATSIADNIAHGDFTNVIERGTATKEIDQLLKSLSVMQDEIRDSQQEILNAKELAEQANLAKSHFLSRMSHELRTPMNAILGFGQLLQMELDKNTAASQRESVEEIMRAGNHLLELINEVLDLARIEEGKFDMSLEKVMLSELVGEALSLLKPLADQRRIKIINNQTESRDYVVNVDRLRFKQVLINLFSNAIKYNTVAGFVTVDAMPCEDDKEMLRVCVTDTGPGIAFDQQKKLFQPFERLEVAPDVVEGTGIGLALTKRMVELMNGKVGFKSQPGKGSSFWVDMELVEQVERTQPSSVESIHSPMHQSQGMGYKVLYVEDNAANLRLVEQLLRQREDIVLISAHTGTLGVELALSHKPDLILLDINLPEMDGFQVLKKLKSSQETLDVPVVAVTANAMPRDIAAGRAAGFSDYLVKPLDIGLFRQILDVYVPLRQVIKTKDIDKGSPLFH